MNCFTTRVVTKDLKIVKVEPVCYDKDGFSIVYVDEQGILYYGISYLTDLLKVKSNIITVCSDTSISDENLLESVKVLIEEFSE